MKKFTFIFAAVFAALFAFADGITSVNIVGYQQLGYECAKSPLVGFTFMPITSGGKMTLADIKATNMNPDSDAIQLLDPNTTKTQHSYTYVSQEEADSWCGPTEPAGTYDDYVGWWDVGRYGNEATDESRDDVELDLGVGFLLSNAAGRDIQFTSAGAVPMESTSFTTSGKSALVATYMPTEMILGDIVVGGGMNPDSDAVQLLDPDTTKEKNQYTYVSKEEADSWGAPGENDDYIGWWDVGRYGNEPSDESRNNVPIKPGTTFLLSNPSGRALIFQYKAALDVTKPTAD